MIFINFHDWFVDYKPVIIMVRCYKHKFFRIMALLFMFNLQQLSIAYSQSNELIHLRLFESEAPAVGVSKLHSFPADSTFIFFFRTGQTNINVGI